MPNYLVISVPFFSVSLLLFLNVEQFLSYELGLGKMCGVIPFILMKNLFRFCVLIFSLCRHRKYLFLLKSCRQEICISDFCYNKSKGIAKLGRNPLWNSKFKTYRTARLTHRMKIAGATSKLATWHRMHQQSPLPSFHCKQRLT